MNINFEDVTTAKEEYLAALETAKQAQESDTISEEEMNDLWMNVDVLLEKYFNLHSERMGHKK